jgi:DNA repair exonuclease SbcCD nuclease subunit
MTPISAIPKLVLFARIRIIGWQICFILLCYNLIMKFLHLADVHLGCTRYQLAESPRDFFDAWMDVLQRYAVDENVDFVIMCGDFFHKRSIPPETMNHAVEGLRLLKENDIPVVAIEGNHDQKHTDSEYSWLRSLADWGYLSLLEPTYGVNGISFGAEDTDARKGFVDIGRARIFGSHWYGAMADVQVPELAEAISSARRSDAFHIVLLHTDVEGQQTHPGPVLSIAALDKLRSAVDYVALGHSHKQFEIDNSIFNPGSLEITNVSGYRETRGVYLIEVSEEKGIEARHIDDYLHRPFQRLDFDVSGRASGEEITEAVIEKIDLEGKRAVEGGPAPIIELTLRGILGLPNSQLELKKIRDEAKKLTGAFHIRVRNHTTPLDYTGRDLTDDNEGRELIERRVVEELVIRDNRFKTQAEEIASLVIGVKRDVLNDESPEKIAEAIGSMTR